MPVGLTASWPPRLQCIHPITPHPQHEQVVGQSAGMVAVCKPHGMPVHVSGQFRKNTVLGILTAERPDLGPLFPVHRSGQRGRAGQGRAGQPTARERGCS